MSDVLNSLIVSPVIDNLDLKFVNLTFNDCTGLQIQLSKEAAAALHLHLGFVLGVSDWAQYAKSHGVQTLKDLPKY